MIIKAVAYTVICLIGAFLIFYAVRLCFDSIRVMKVNRAKCEFRQSDLFFSDWHDKEYVEGMAEGSHITDPSAIQWPDQGFDSQYIKKAAEYMFSELARRAGMEEPFFTAAADGHEFDEEYGWYTVYYYDAAGTAYELTGWTDGDRGLIAKKS